MSEKSTLDEKLRVVMEKQTRGRPGKLFYIAVAMLLVCVIVPAGAFAAMFYHETERSSQQIRSLIESIMDSGIAEYSAVYPENDEEADIGSTVNGDGMLDSVTSLSDLDEAAQAELLVRLAKVQAGYVSYEGYAHCVSLLFVESGELLSADEESAGAFTEEDLDVIRGYGFGQGGTAAYLHNDGTLRTSLVYALTDDVYLLTTKTEEDPIESALGFLLTLEDVVEVAQYDVFGTVRLVSGDGTIASTFSLADFTALDDTEAISFELEGQSYLCCYRAYSGAGMVIAVFLVDNVVDAANNVRLMLALIVVATVAVCVLFLFVFGRNVYLPLRQLASRVAPEDEGGFDELKDLERGIARLETESEGQGALVRQAALLHLLHGNDALATESQSQGFPFDERDLCVIVGALVEPLGDGPVQTEHAVARLSADLATSGLGRHVVVSDGVLQVFIVEMTGGRKGDETTRAMTRAVVDAGEASREALQRAGECSLSLFVSEPVEGGMGLKKGYDQVSRLSEQCLAMERYGIILEFGDLDAPEQENGLLDVEDMQRFLDAAHDLSIARAQACFDDIVAKSYATGENVVRRNDQTISTLCTLMRLGLASCPTAKASGVDWEARLNVALEGATSVEDLRDALLSTMRAIEAAGERESLDKSRFAQVEAYVRENITDANLSGQLVASHFGMAQSNLTRMFKKFTGDGFLAYVHALRVERARDVLAQSDATIEDVAEQVGFGNALTMTRAFKKATGLTPHAYRESCREKPHEGKPS